MVTKPPADQPDALQAVPYTDDVVEYTLRCVLALAPSFQACLARQIEAQVRGTFGGARVYVGKRAGEGAATRNAAIRRDYRAGERLELLERRYGLGRVQLWRIINDVPNR